MFFWSRSTAIRSFGSRRNSLNSVSRMDSPDYRRVARSCGSTNLFSRILSAWFTTSFHQSIMNYLKNKEKNIGKEENLIKSNNKNNNFVEIVEPPSKFYSLGNVMGKADSLFECVPPEGRSMDNRRLRNGENVKIEEERQVYCYQQWEPNLIKGEKGNEILFRNKKKFHHSQQLKQQPHQREEKNYNEELLESSRSEEEEAATTIQAVYRGYKARRRFNEIRKTSSDEQQKAKRVAELLAMPLAKNLHTPLEPVKVSTSFVCQSNNNNKQSCSSPRKKKRDSFLTEENEPSNSRKDLEGIRFDAISPLPTPRAGKKCRQNNLQAVKSSTNLNDATKPIQTIKSASFFRRCDERLSSITPSENTDTEDPFSPIIDERSTIDLQTTRESLRQCVTYNEELGQIMKNSENRPKPKARGINTHNVPGINRQLPQRMSSSVLGDQGKNYYYKKNSLFYPEQEAVLIFGGIDPHEEYGCTGNSGKDIYRFKPSENNWEFVGEIPEPRHHHSVVYLKGKIYLVGGADPREDDSQQKSTVVDTVWSYDPTSRIWFNESGMLTARKNFGLVVSHGKMFAIGGQDRNGIALKSVEAFDPTDSIWREMRSMFTARVGPASAKYQNRIWVAGGMTKSKKEPLSKEVECYDPSENLWLKASPLRSPRCFASMYVISDCLYLIGGAGNASRTENVTESMNSIDVWDQNYCGWREEGEMAIARHGHSIGSIGDQLLIIGGVTTIYMGTLKSVECYCCERANWIKGVSALPYAISGHGTVSLPPVNLLVDP